MPTTLPRHTAADTRSRSAVGSRIVDEALVMKTAAANMATDKKRQLVMCGVEAPIVLSSRENATTEKRIPAIVSGGPAPRDARSWRKACAFNPIQKESIQRAREPDHSPRLHQGPTGKPAFPELRHGRLLTPPHHLLKPRNLEYRALNP
ncbi:MAG TPA: hypothetical protein PLK78_12165 [Verrucomicrobiota bacterium]|nr:hypothetical protein [Verrucomicrobiota bacterium]